MASKKLKSLGNLRHNVLELFWKYEVFILNYYRLVSQVFYSLKSPDSSYKHSCINCKEHIFNSTAPREVLSWSPLPHELHMSRISGMFVSLEKSTALNLHLCMAISQ